MSEPKLLLLQGKPKDTVVSRLCGRTKIAVFLCIVVAMVATEDLRIVGSLFVLALSIMVLIVKPPFKSIRFPLMFVILLNLINTTLFYLINPALGTSDAGSATVLLSMGGRWIIYYESLWYYLVRLLKFMGGFVMSINLIFSITSSQIAAGVNRIGVTYKIATVFSIAFRYIPDISRDMNDTAVALQARGQEMDAKHLSLFGRLRQRVLILMPLLVNSFARIDNISNSLVLRGFGKNKKRSWYCEKRDDPKELIWIGLGIALVVFVIAYRIYLSQNHLPIMWYPY
ncbi:MAG: energy-coupling factor transporter transmembrane protein EcfT [Erysipelotrichaceae bacterium]|jgi:energy-coupling factor transport system permease protein|nr:energy-coupling factor transporter transmembrane protein EcfT [Erysipelotrichaceae bacterium]